MPSRHMQSTLIPAFSMARSSGSSAPTCSVSPLFCSTASKAPPVASTSLRNCSKWMRPASQPAARAALTTASFSGAGPQT